MFSLLQDLSDINDLLDDEGWDILNGLTEDELAMLNSDFDPEVSGFQIHRKIILCEMVRVRTEEWRKLYYRIGFIVYTLYMSWQKRSRKHSPQKIEEKL